MAFAPELTVELVNDVEPQSPAPAEEPQSPGSPPLSQLSAAAASALAHLHLSASASPSGAGASPHSGRERERDSGLSTSLALHSHFWPRLCAAADSRESHALLLSACNAYQPNNTALQTFHGMLVLTLYSIFIFGLSIGHILVHYSTLLVRVQQYCTIAHDSIFLRLITYNSPVHYYGYTCSGLVINTYVVLLN